MQRRPFGDERECASGEGAGDETEIRKNGTKPDYGVLVRSLGKAKGFDAPSVHLQSLHDMRSNGTALITPPADRSMKTQSAGR